MVFDYKEVLKYCSELMITERPDWISRYDVVVDDPAYRLLSFNTKQKNDSVPVLIVPPQAGHHSCIADFGSPEQSLVNTCAKRTGNVVYGLEWKNSIRLEETIDDLVLYLDVCVENAGGRAHLIGLCQGGWLATIYAAIYPEKVASLLLGAAPIDFHAGESKVQDFVKRIPMKGYEMMVRSGGGFLRGDVMLSGWKMTNPYDRYVQDYLNLWASIQDDDKLERSKKFRTWYEYTQNISGRWYLQAVYELFKKNKLITGTLRILHRNVDLKRITCPVAMLSGERDDITPFEQVDALADYVSTPKKNMFKRVIPKAGHIGVFMRTGSQPHWDEALGFVIDRLPDHLKTLREAVAA
jgi:poly(3-hydroxybutyrate) depolymerase